MDAAKFGRGVVSDAEKRRPRAEKLRYDFPYTKRRKPTQKRGLCHGFICLLYVLRVFPST